MVGRLPSKQTSRARAAELSEEQRETIRRIAAKHGARQVRLFGSLARGEADPDSDIDLLVVKGSNTTPWFPAGLVLELETLLGRKVDVVTESGLSPYLRETILREAVPL
jgi:predicted nucleotidyltransferase